MSIYKIHQFPWNHQFFWSNQANFIPACKKLHDPTGITLQCCGTISTFHIVEVSLLHLKRKMKSFIWGFLTIFSATSFEKHLIYSKKTNGQAFKIADVQKSTGEFSHVVYLKEFFSKQTLEIRDNPSANFHDFWPLTPYHHHSRKMLMKRIFDPYVLWPFNHRHMGTPFPH